MADDPSQPKLGRHGGLREGAGRPKKGESRERENQVDDINLKTEGRYKSKPDNVRFGYGTSRAYILARLDRDGHAELAAKVRAGKMSANAAAVELGWAKRPQTVQGEARPRAIDPVALIG